VVFEMGELSSHELMGDFIGVFNRIHEMLETEYGEPKMEVKQTNMSGDQRKQYSERYSQSISFNTVMFPDFDKIDVTASTQHGHIELTYTLLQDNQNLETIVIDKNFRGNYTEKMRDLIKKHCSANFQSFIVYTIKTINRWHLLTPQILTVEKFKAETKKRIIIIKENDSSLVHFRLEHIESLHESYKIELFQNNTPIVERMLEIFNETSVKNAVECLLTIETLVKEKYPEPFLRLFNLTNSYLSKNLLHWETLTTSARKNEITEHSIVVENQNSSFFCFKLVYKTTPEAIYEIQVQEKVQGNQKRCLGTVEIDTCEEQTVNDAVRNLILDYCIFRRKEETTNPVSDSQRTVLSKAILHTMDRLVHLL
jgi:hypothetical protein